MRIILFLLLSWYTIGNIQAQIKEPVKFKNELKMTSETEAEIVFTASIEKGWHVYSTGLGDDGPISATFNINALPAPLSTTSFSKVPPVMMTREVIPFHLLLPAFIRTGPWKVPPLMVTLESLFVISV